jgi:N-acylneuraminate cytidylyltransferase
MKIAIMLLARKGSKRIPKKNIKPFCGKPLVEYTLEFMKTLKYESHVYTDSIEIEALCKKHEIMAHGKKYENKEGIHHTKEELIFYNETVKADIIILLQATSPLRNKEGLERGLKSLINSPEYNICLSVNKIDKIIYDDKAQRLIKDRDFNNKKHYYIESGSFYIFKKEQLQKNHITDGKRIFYIDKYDIDLDTEKDWEKAEILYKGGYYEN